MPKKGPVDYKTEEQLKREARERREAEAALAAQKPKTPAELKRENFWYHYKWHTVIGAVVFVFAAFFIKDTFFCSIPDATVVMISSRPLSFEDTEAIADAFEQIAHDRNGDKKVLINVDFIGMPSAETETATTQQQDYANIVKLTAVLSVGADPIFLMDEDSYNQIAAMSSQDGGAARANDIFHAESVSANGLGLPQFDNMRLYLRKSQGEDEGYYDYCEQLLKEIDRG